ncbi:hypothetical protein [Altererythrobacter sp. B11]|uniref:hypothetical protein n=1 Tax=Altererythrobacter sp. B11 TaxID=2060312 RepID=UPI0011AE4C16|nr:hypothetical protein [Altererythrobacter sp. B11]
MKLKGEREKTTEMKNFRRPIVPSRSIEILCFGVSVVAVGAILLYAVWAASRGLIEWSAVPLVGVMMSMGAAPLLVMGYVWRRRRQKRAAELREYERVLAALPE